MIELEKLTKTYGGKDNGIHNISVELKDGKIYGLVGENGAGKTTLIKTITGIFRQNSGSVSINGYDSTRERTEALMNVGLMPDGVILNIDRSILQQISFYGQTRGMGEDESVEKAGMLMTRFGLGEKLHDASLRRLSLGQKRRAMLAMCMMTDPGNILMDEPYNGFDPDGMRMLNELITYERSKGKTIIISSHILKELESVVDEIIFIKNGRISDQLEISSLDKIGKKKILFSVSNPNDEILTLMEEYGGIRKIGNQYEVSISPDKKVKPEDINTALVKSGYSVSSFKVENPSLEDLYFSKK